jgi:N-acetylglucosamine kinase-like BadF-type ATPase
MSIYIGIEGVGVRQSVAAASDSTGEIIAACRMLGEPLSLHSTDRENLRSSLARLLREVAHRSGRNLRQLTDSTLCIGMTGATFDAELDLASEFRKLEIPVANVVCTGDAEMILASHATSLEGSVLLCNNGATSFVAKQGLQVRHGGWGPAIGDAGSATWIGREALRDIFEELGEGAKPSALWKTIDSWLSGQRSSEYPDWRLASIQWLQHRDQPLGGSRRGQDARTALLRFANFMVIHHPWEWRSLVGGLTIPVMQLWRDGDSRARDIVESAAKQLARLHKSACARVNSPVCPSPLVLYGSRSEIVPAVPCLGTILAAALAFPDSVDSNDPIDVGGSTGARRRRCDVPVFPGNRRCRVGPAR